MALAAASPEELETLLEDALVLYDGAALQDLFERGRVRVTGGVALEGGPAGELLVELGFLAGDSPIRCCPDLAIGVGAAITVSRRGPDRRWRLVAVIGPTPH